MDDDRMAVVRPLEMFAEKNPDAYKFRVAVLTVLGYAYLLFEPLFEDLVKVVRRR